MANCLFKKLPLHRYVKKIKIWNPMNNISRSFDSIPFYQLLRNMPATSISLLSNGLTVATEERDSCNVCFGLYIDAGSRHENENENGLTHFFEHIAFKGSQKRSKTALETEISKSGAKFKCNTSRDMCSYYVQCMSADLQRNADVLFDCLFNNAFAESEIEIQKDTVYQEMLELDKSSVNVMYDYLHSTAFQGTKLGQTVMGPSSNLYNFKAKNLYEHVVKLFIPERMVLVGIGGMKHEMMVSLGEQYFCKVENPACIILGPRRYTGSEVNYRNDSMYVAHVAIGVEGPIFCDVDKLVMELASFVIGGWDASQPGGRNHGTRLAYVGSSAGFCESYKPFFFCYQDTSLWGVEFISPGKVIDDMLLYVQDEWMKLCHTVTDNELIRAKNEMKTNILTKTSRAAGAFHDIGRNVLRTGCRPSYEQRLESIDKITANDIKNICDKYIYDKCPVVSAIGATECLLPYPRFRADMYWLRI